MSKRKFYYFSIGIFCLFFLQGFARAQTPTPTPESTPVTAEETKTESPPPPDSAEKTEADLIHTGDLIDVDIVGSTEYDWRGKLTPEGFLNGINFVEEPIYGLCRAEEEVAAAVAKG